MKKYISILLAVFLLAATLTACGGKENKTVSTDGSTSMQKVMLALGEAFMNNNSGTTVTYNGTGSGTGIKAVKDGTCDIGLSSRYLKDSEKAEGLKETILAIDGIAIIVHPNNTVTDLTLEQIAKIYTGEITNWSEVGGNDAEIVLIKRCCYIKRFLGIVCMQWLKSVIICFITVYVCFRKSQTAMV